MAQELWIERSQLAAISVHTRALPALAADQVLLEIERLALTANNATYALLGEKFHYWRQFPAGPLHGILPAWGFAKVLASEHPEVPVGEYCYGFLPLASHWVMQPGQVSATGWQDASAHRAALPAVYNRYATRLPAPAQWDQFAVLQPLFATAWLLAQELIGQFPNDTQLCFTSASSRTALATAWLLRGAGFQMHALTSESRTDWLRAHGLFASVSAYGDLKGLSRQASVILDFAGNSALLAALTAHFDAQLRATLLIGATHSAGPAQAQARDPRSQVFFAPSLYQRYQAQLGGAELAHRIQIEREAYLAADAGSLAIQAVLGSDAIASAYQRLLRGELGSGAALMARFR